MICFHHNDADGRCAAAIVYSQYPESRFKEMDYNKSFDIKLLIKDETIFIVDFSFKPEIMKEILFVSENIIWIDHHKTILNHPFNNKEIAGIRDTSMSGCELTWKWIYDNEMPLSVKLIGDYDTWKLELLGSKAFRFGLDLYDHGPKEEIWRQLLTDNNCCENIIQKGDIVLNFIHKFGDDYCKSYGFETEFEGHRCFAQGVYNFGSDFFGDKLDKYDFCLAFEFTGNNWIVGLYSTKIDVSEIAKKYGGGGHKGAAGFVCNKLPFNK